MTDRPTPTTGSTATEPRTEAGRLMESWLREADDYEWGRKITAAICAIESEAAGEVAFSDEQAAQWLSENDLYAATHLHDDPTCTECHPEAREVTGQQRLHATMCFDAECPKCARSAGNQ